MLISKETQDGENSCRNGNLRESTKIGYYMGKDFRDNALEKTAQIIGDDGAEIIHGKSEYYQKVGRILKYYQIYIYISSFRGSDKYDSKTHLWRFQLYPSRPPQYQP